MMDEKMTYKSLIGKILNSNKIRFFWGIVILLVCISLPFGMRDTLADENAGNVSIPEGTLLDRDEFFALDDSEIIRVNGDTSLYSIEKSGANEYAYNSLNDTEKKIFNAIGEAFETFLADEKYSTDLDTNSAVITIEYTLEDGESISKENLCKVMTRFQYANPKYYWLDGGFSYGVAGNECRIVPKVAPDYYTAASRKTVDDAIAQLLPAWVEEIKEISNDDIFMAALKAHDLIIGNIDYAYDSKGKPETALWAHSIAGVFTGRNAVCEGYAKTFEYLLDLAGIQNIYILGIGDSEAHAWNAVLYKEEWYLCDITWDDPNEEDDLGFNNTKYTYFFMPSNLFSKNHKAFKENEYDCYGMPDFSDNLEESFFGRFKCVTSDSFDETSGPAFAGQVLANRYKGCDYIYIAFPKGQEQAAIRYVLPQITGQQVTSGYYSSTPYGSMMKVLAPVIENPSLSISLDKEEIELEVDGDTIINAVLSENSDDRIIWELIPFNQDDTFSAKRYVKLSADGSKAVIKGLKDGMVILKATVYSSTLTDNVLTASCKIKVGTGESSSDAVIWQNGTKEFKSITITPTITATAWTDSKGKTKNGKLVWFVSDTVLVPSFKSDNHTVSFGSSSKSKKASVSAKGVVTAKKAGKVYIYVCDTGSMTYEEYSVDILAAPAKLFITDEPGATGKDNILKKYGLNAGDTDKVYITPYIKDGEADPDCIYEVKLSKAEQASYLMLGDVMTDEKGNKYFSIRALDFDKAKKKPVSVKVDIVCKQSNKKTNITVVIGNPVINVTAKADGTETNLSLAKKADSVSLKLNLETNMGDVTTDKIKIYVGKTYVSLDNRGKPSLDKGASIKAKYDEKNAAVILTASKDAGTPAVVTAAFTDAVTKKVKLFELVKIDAEGKLTINSPIEET